MAVAGVESHGDEAFDGRLHEQRLEVEGKHLDGPFAGAVSQRGAHLPLKRGIDKAVVGVLGGGLDKLHCGGAGLHHRAAQERQRKIAVKQNGCLELFFLFAAVDGENLVPLQLCNRLRKVVVQAIDAVLFCRGEGAERAALFQQLTQAFADGCVVADPLGDDVVCALQRVGDGLDALFRVEVVLRESVRRGHAARLREDRLGQRLEPLFAGDGRAGAALLLVGPVEILDLGERRGLVDDGGQLVRQLALRLDRGLDLIAPGL